MHQIAIGQIRNGKDVWWHLGSSPIHIHVRNRLGINRQHFVRVDEDTKEARIRLKSIDMKVEELHRSSSSSIADEGCAKRKLHSKKSSWPCLRSFRTLLDLFPEFLL